MKKTTHLKVAVVLAGLVFSSFLADSAHARTKQITYGNGDTWTVNRSGGGNVSKTFTGQNYTYNYTRTCADGSCSKTKSRTPNP